jgi:hypothetical protein
MRRAIFNLLEPKNMRHGNVVLLLPVKEDGIEEDDKASVFFT